MVGFLQQKCWLLKYFQVYTDNKTEQELYKSKVHFFSLLF